jgi:protein TonB
VIARSHLAKFAALLLAGGAHAALLIGLVDPEPTLVEGRAGGTEARLGTSFRDLAEGGAAVPVTQTATQAIAAETSDTATAVAAARPIAPPLQAVAMATPAGPMQAEVSSPPMERVATPHRPPEAARPVAPDRAASPVAPAVRASSVTSEPATPQHAETVLQAAADASAAPAVSRRPQHRPEGIERRPMPTTAAPERATPPPSAPGNATRNATAGTETGRTDAPSASSGSAAAQAAAGSAAASNYPGVVMRCISRAGRPRSASRGTAVVSFRIGGNGRITDVALAAGSGDPGLDGAALRTIDGAGPCPPPPPGAQTAFSIRIEGR